MKTAGRKKPNRWANASSNRAHGAAVQHRSCSVKWAAKQENVQPLEMCFLLTSPFIELIRTDPTNFREERLHAAVANLVHWRSAPSFLCLQLRETSACRQMSCAAEGWLSEFSS